MSSGQPAGRSDQVIEIPLGVAVTAHPYPNHHAGLAGLIAFTGTQCLGSSASVARHAARALIDDGQVLVYAGLRVLLEGSRRIAVAVQAAAGEEALAPVRRARPLQAQIEAPLPGLDRMRATGRTSTAANGAAAASRARLVDTVDETRRQIERALHDGTQQRLVTLALELQAVKDAVGPERPDVIAQLSHVEDGLMAALEELREIARGVHPAILSEGGLRPALMSLARRSAVPMVLELGVHRLPEPVEVAVYYVVSEALANTVKHAHASVIRIKVTVVDHILHLYIRDDGVGGADPARGSGLLGLEDRIEILGGAMTVQSPRGAGTSLQVKLPLQNGASRTGRRTRSPRQVRHRGDGT